MPSKLDIALAVLNGLVGDHLERSQNGLAIPMSFVHQGTAIKPEPSVLRRIHPEPSRRVVVLVHGLMCDEGVFRFPDGRDYGSLLANDADMTPFYIRYNSGAAIVDNGRALSALLDRLIGAYPGGDTELTLLGYSMGGLVVRAACHHGREANLPWIENARRAVYVGTPHGGAPLERGGRLLTSVLRAIPDPYTRLIADVADLRSRGLRDLGDADLASPIDLDPGLDHFFLTGKVSGRAAVGDVLGDWLVPVQSGTFAAHTASERGLVPEHHVRVFEGRHHVDMARDPDVYDAIRSFLT